MLVELVAIRATFTMIRILVITREGIFLKILYHYGAMSLLHLLHFKILY